MWTGQSRALWTRHRILWTGQCIPVNLAFYKPKLSCIRETGGGGGNNSNFQKVKISGHIRPSSKWMGDKRYSLKISLPSQFLLSNIRLQLGNPTFLNMCHWCDTAQYLDPTPVLYNHFFCFSNSIWFESTQSFLSLVFDSGTWKWLKRLCFQLKVQDKAKAHCQNFPSTNIFVTFKF